MKPRTAIISTALLLSSCFFACSAFSDEETQAFINRSQRQYALKMYEQSVESATHAINLGTSDFTPYMLRGLSLHALNHDKEALKDLIAAARLSDKKPLPIDCYIVMSECYLAQRSIRNALAELDRANSFYPKSDHIPDVLRHRLAIYMCLKDYPHAIADANRLVELCGSQGPWTFELRAKVQMQFAHYKESVADYSRAIKIAPDVSEYYRQRAIGYFKLGKSDLAEDDKKKAAALHGGGHPPS